MLEMTIVLTVIALLTGMVAAARAALLYAKLHRVIGEFQKNVTYVKNFRTNHLNYLPGDLPIASQYWTNFDNPHIRRVCNSNMGSAALNGNGNKIIGGVTLVGSCPGELTNIASNKCETMTTSNEYVLAICHLYLYGLTQDQDSPYKLNIGTLGSIVVPSSPSLDGGFVLYSSMLGNTSTTNISNVIAFAGQGNNNSLLSSSGRHNFLAPSISPAGAFYIDTKIDSGYPAEGLFRAYNSTGSNNHNCLAKVGHIPQSYQQYTELFTGKDFRYNVQASGKNAISCLPQYIID